MNAAAGCQHQPLCPSAEAPDREAARIKAHRPAQGWSLLCNGILLFEDSGELLPDGQAISPHRTVFGGTVLPQLNARTRQ